MHVAILWRMVDWFSLPLLAVLVGILIWRRVNNLFPYFLYYIVIDELIGLVRFAFYNPRTLKYFYIYWTTDVLIAVFAFLATYELFVRRLFSQFYRITFYRYLFPVVALIITLIAVPAALRPRGVPKLLLLIHVFDVLRVTVLIFFVGLMIFMGRRWTRYELGIALGLAVQAAAVLISSAVWARQPLVRNVLERLPVIAFDVACLVWLITFLKAEHPAASASGPFAPEVVQQAKKWQETLKDSLSNKKSP